MPERLQTMHDRMLTEIAEPFVGVSATGSVEPGLFKLQPTGVSTARMVDAACAFLAALDPADRAAVHFDLDDAAWRSWSNISPFLLRHGLLLERMSESTRALALDLVRASLGEAGWSTARDVMRLNDHIGEITGHWNEYGEFVYWLSMFGEPSADGAWGWQIDGHHLIVNCMVVGDQVVLTPQFMGSEPVVAEFGKHQGTRVFRLEEERGFALMRSLSDEQQRLATVGMQLPMDALSTAPHDNLVLPYAGIRADQLAGTQRDALWRLVETYVARWPAGHAEAKLAEARQYLDATWFAWIGACADERPFYYRLYSPVLLIEFDHQAGIALDNDEPSRNHVHTVVRTPNGNDYGKDLLRQHYAEAHHHSATKEASTLRD
jgi:Protein of unknown function (DUF3500)